MTRRSAWARLLEALGGPDDGEDDAVGQAVPRPEAPPWGGHGSLPPGAVRIHRPIALPDGRRGMAWLQRPHGLYDVSVPTRDGRDTEDLVLHDSEFAFRYRQG